MFHRFTHVAALVTLVGSLLTLSAADAHAQIGRNRLDVPVSGVVQGVGTVTGTYGISRFAIRNGGLVATGQLTATVTDTAGNVVNTIVTNVSVPVMNATSGSNALLAIGSCDILNLILGPLHLDLLGLQIDLNQVILNITAQAGAGNLLGNLLCAITGLLDAGALGPFLVGLLNTLISVLAGL
jgi:hypothetical protein